MGTPSARASLGVPAFLGFCLVFLSMWTCPTTGQVKVLENTVGTVSAHFTERGWVSACGPLPSLYPGGHWEITVHHPASPQGPPSSLHMVPWGPQLR